jgi:hypothetical protein
VPRDARRNSAAAAELLDELEGGKGPFIGSAIGLDVPPGFEVKEYVVCGTAAAYRPTGPLTPDGRWPFEADSTAEYRTRILIRRPSEPATASGTVVLEWLNVSGGADSNPEWHSVIEEIIRRGHVWVGVSAQRIGVAGGAVLTHPPSADEAHDVAGRGLTALDPARYESLLHPGDGYSFDIFTQVARALRDGGPATAGMTPDVVLAAGESQSAYALTTYYNGVEPLAAGVFDGFLLHSRSAISLPLVGPGEAADVSRSFGRVEPSVLRDDVDAPVLVLQAEGDVIGPLNSVVVRQPDTDTLRLWEVAGTAHADVHLLGPTAKRIDCGVPINNGPMHVVAKAALHRLEAWIRTGDPPPSAARLEVTDGQSPEIRRDDDGIALGGVRTPPVDVPVDVLSGVPGPNPDRICRLCGSTRPLDPARLAARYPSREAYEEQYRDAVDEVVEAGFVLHADRDALLAFAQPERVAW